MVKVVNFTMCIFCHNFKNGILKRAFEQHKHPVHPRPSTQQGTGVFGGWSTSPGDPGPGAGVVRSRAGPRGLQSLDGRATPPTPQRKTEAEEPPGLCPQARSSPSWLTLSSRSKWPKPQSLDHHHCSQCFASNSVRPQTPQFRLQESINASFTCTPPSLLAQLCPLAASTPDMTPFQTTALHREPQAQKVPPLTQKGAELLAHLCRARLGAGAGATRDTDARGASVLSGLITLLFPQLPWPPAILSFLDLT